MEEFGLVADLVVNVHPGREGVIVGGFQRFEILREDGVRSVIAKIVDLPLERERELNIRLNANGGRFSPALLVSGGFSAAELEAWGFSAADLDAYRKAEKHFAESAAGKTLEKTAPATFPAYNPETIETSYVCPQCAYTWSGPPK